MLQFGTARFPRQQYGRRGKTFGAKKLHIYIVIALEATSVVDSNHAVRHHYVTPVHPHPSLDVGQYPERIEKVHQQQKTSEQDLRSSEKRAAARGRLGKMATYGSMVVMAGRLASETRQRRNKTTAEPSEVDILEEKMAVAAMGAKHTEQQLLQASRLGVLTFHAFSRGKKKPTSYCCGRLSNRDVACTIFLFSLHSKLCNCIQRYSRPAGPRTARS